MADNNRNWSSQSNQGWDQNRNRFDQNDDNPNRENYGGYGNAGYDNDYGSQYRGSGYGESNFGGNRQSGGYGRQNMGNSYGNQQGRENDWNREQGNGYGQSYGRQEWERRNMSTGNYGSGYNERPYGDDYGSSSGYGDYSGQNRRRYGGGNRNFGSSDLRSRVNKWLDRAKEEVSYWFNNDDDNDDRRRREYGGHRGKGPSDYRRSADRIKEDICDRLTDDDRVDASNIRVQMEDDVVILSGTVSSREEKRRAEYLVESVSGVQDVENRIRVSRSDSGLNDKKDSIDRTLI